MTKTENAKERRVHKRAAGASATAPRIATRISPARRNAHISPPRRRLFYSSRSLPSLRWSRVDKTIYRLQRRRPTWRTGNSRQKTFTPPSLVWRYQWAKSAHDGNVGPVKPKFAATPFPQTRLSPSMTLIFSFPGAKLSAVLNVSSRRRVISAVEPDEPALDF